MVQVKIYVGHASSFDFHEKLYRPLRDSELDEKHEIVLPHEESEELFDSRTFFEEDCDLFIAEVSRASTGLGIELGWADEYDVPIICVHREDSNPSDSIEAVTEDIVEYEDSKSLIELLEAMLEV